MLQRICSRFVGFLPATLLFVALWTILWASFDSRPHMATWCFATGLTGLLSFALSAFSVACLEQDLQEEAEQGQNE